MPENIHNPTTEKADVVTYQDFCALVIGLPARGRTPEQQAQLEAWLNDQEKVRQRFIELCSSSPLYRQRLEKHPDFWKNCSIGGINL